MLLVPYERETAQVSDVRFQFCFIKLSLIYFLDIKVDLLEVYNLEVISFNLAENLMTTIIQRYGIKFLKFYSFHVLKGYANKKRFKIMNKANVSGEFLVNKGMGWPT